MKIDNLNLNRFLGLDISNFQLEDVFIITIKLTIGRFLTFLYPLLILSQRLLLLFYSPLHPLVPKGRHKLINTDVRIDREAIFQLKELFSRVLISLVQSDIGDRIVDSHIILG